MHAEIAPLHDVRVMQQVLWRIGGTLDLSQHLAFGP